MAKKRLLVPAVMKTLRALEKPQEFWMFAADVMGTLERLQAGPVSADDVYNVLVKTGWDWLIDEDYNILPPWALMNGIRVRLELGEHEVQTRRIDLRRLDCYLMAFPPDDAGDCDLPRFLTPDGRALEVELYEGPTFEEALVLDGLQAAAEVRPTRSRSETRQGPGRVAFAAGDSILLTLWPKDGTVVVEHEPASERRRLVEVEGLEDAGWFWSPEGQPGLGEWPGAERRGLAKGGWAKQGERGSKVMRFKVELQRAPVYRVLELLPEHTLHDLHNLIQAAFGWDDDHPYAFFMDRKGWRSKERYWSPFSEDKPSADDVMLWELDLRPRRKFQYLFDFGDEWWHDVQFLGYAPREPGVQYPRIAEAVGNPPPQYRDLEDGWEDEGGGDPEGA